MACLLCVSRCKFSDQQPKNRHAFTLSSPHLVRQMPASESALHRSSPSTLTSLLSGLFSASCILPQPSSRDLASPPQGPPSPPCRSTSVVDQRQALTFAHLNRISPNVIGKPCLSFLARARLMSCRLAVAETYSTRRRRKAAMVIYRSTTDTFFSSDERNKKDRARRENVRLRTRFVRVRNRYMLCSSGRRRT
jgi:hypothetical protein